MDVGLPLTIFHFYIKRDGKKKLDKILEIEGKSVSNGLTFACLFFVATGGSSRLGTFTVSMNGVQSNKLLPRPLHQLDPKDLLQKAPLLKSNL